MNPVDKYIAGLDDSQRDAVSQLRDTIKSNLPSGFDEVMAGSMPGYVVPLKIYPTGYHVGKDTPLPFINFAAQKSHIALYHFGMYVDSELMEWFETAWSKHTDAKLDMGKSCIRFKKPDQIPFELIAELVRQRTVADWIAAYDSVRPK